MKYWIAVVDGYRRREPRSRWIESFRWRFVLAAASFDDAWRLAASFAEDAAPMGPKWIKFEVIECASVALPLRVQTIKRPAVKVAA